MVFSRVFQIIVQNQKTMLYKTDTNVMLKRFKTHYRSGAIKPMPEQLPHGILKAMAAVIPGLLIGAAISKSIANFLEENDLFVPSDDDDDDD